MYKLRELYLKFKEQNPEIKIGFNKFVELRPEYCILAGASGTHTVFVSVYHQNVKLMLDGLNISELTSGEIKNYKDCINEIVCKVPTAQCYLNTCSNCPTVEPLKSRLLTLLENSNVHEITYKMWKSTDRSTLTKETTCSKTFIDQLTENLVKLKTHSFISKKQPSYFQHLRDTLRKGKFLICLDFSENYTFVVQDVIQLFHFNNNQSSLATAVVYYRSSDDSIQHKSMGIFFR